MHTYIIISIVWSHSLLIIGIVLTAFISILQFFGITQKPRKVKKIGLVYQSNEPMAALFF